MWFKVLCFLFFFSILFNSGFAQSCQGFYKSSRCASKQASDFKQYGQAKSAAVEVGKKYKYTAVLYGNKDYIINVCTEAGYKKVHFSIYDKTNNKSIYDNEEDDYNTGVAFSVENTSNVEIEIEILSEKEEGTDPEMYRVCVGVQILWRKIPKMGFDK
jgi:hypothetical protein